MFTTKRSSTSSTRGFANSSRREPIEYAVEYKIDGVAIAVTYENGVLIQAVTRGDGTRGDDITNNARTIRGLPLRLRTKKPPAVLEVRGEAYISNSDFARLVAERTGKGHEAFANPRNTAAGGLKLLDPKFRPSASCGSLLTARGSSKGSNSRTHRNSCESIRDWDIPSTPNVQLCAGIEKARDAANEMAKEVHTLDFEVDGIVLKVNDFAQRGPHGPHEQGPALARRLQVGEVRSDDAGRGHRRPRRQNGHAHAVCRL